MSCPKEWIDTPDAVQRLTPARAELPAGVFRFLREDDGLPAPDDAAFARAAGRFLRRHPSAPAEQIDPPLWDNTAVASRQWKCLAYLSSGGPEERPGVARLCVEQARRLQWALPIDAQLIAAGDNAFYSAVGALALSGAWLMRAGENGSAERAVGTQWRLTGLGQLATSGRRGHPLWRALSAVLSAAGRTPSLEISDADFFNQLDLARPDMRAVRKWVGAGDFARARAAYQAALADRFAAKRKWPRLFAGPAADLKEADDLGRNIFLLQTHMFRRCDFGNKVAWDKAIDHDADSLASLNAHSWMWTLLNAYRQTRNDAYVAHLCRLFRSWYAASPPPFRRSNAQWRTLETGGRVGQKWSAVLTALDGHPIFRRECLFLMARSILDHGRLLCMYAAPGGNWLQVEASGLACVALLLPELKLAPHFYHVAMQRLARVNARAFLPDGFQAECSPAYHRFPLLALVGAVQLAKHLRQPLPESLTRQCAAGLAALQQIAYPDQTLPMLSDTSPRRHSTRELLGAGADVFGRKDFRWFGSGGRRGAPPAAASHDLTHAGYCVMRDRWGPGGQVLIFDAGALGAGHWHEDKLNFVYYAGGRELIGDPGIYSYQHDEFEPYWRGSWSHNTVTVDGLSQHRALGPAEKMPDPDRRFVMGRDFDFACGWYRRAYSSFEEEIGSGAPARVLRGIRHQRCVFFLKGRYAVICDRLIGPGERRIDIFFHPAPSMAGRDSRRDVRAVDLKIYPDRRVVTCAPHAANVAIIPAQGGEMKVLDVIGQRRPVRGWYALRGIQPSHDVAFRWKGALPRHFETVIQPLAPGRRRSMTVEMRDVSVAGSRACAAVACGRDLFLVSYAGPAAMESGGVAFRGTAALLVRDASGRTVRACLVDGASLSLDGRRVFAAKRPRPAATVDLPEQ